jgi:hypothetical protein
MSGTINSSAQTAIGAELEKGNEEGIERSSTSETQQLFSSPFTFFISCISTISCTLIA